jgi:hypothetical protein
MRRTGRALPTTVRAASLAQVGLVVLTGLATVLAVLLRDDLLAEWYRRHPTGIEPPAFAPVAVVLFVTYALLAGVLLVFFRGGHREARWGLTLLAAFFAFTMVVLVRQDPPTLFVVLAIGCAVVDAAVAALLWRRETTAFLRGPLPAAGTS